MIDPTFATIAVAVKSKTYDKMLGNIREIKARQGEVVAIAGMHDTVIDDYADRVIRIPETEELFSPVSGRDPAATAGILCRQEPRAIDRSAP